MRLFRVLGHRHVHGVGPGDISNFEHVEPGAVRALVLGGHLQEVEESAETESSDARVDTAVGTDSATVIVQQAPPDVAADNTEGSADQ